MNSIIRFAGGLAAGLFSVYGSALALVNGSGCGVGGNPCNVPEPGSLPLVLVGIVGVAVVARFLKK